MQLKKMTGLTAVFFVLAALISAMTVTLAAYTSLTSVKRVVTVRGSEQYFTSDILLPYQQEDQMMNRVLTFNEADENKVITLTVANHLQEDENAFDGRDIRYRLKVTILDGADMELYDHIRINGQPCAEMDGYLEGGISGEDTYQIALTDNSLLQYRLQVTAEAANRKEYLPLGRVFLFSSSDTTTEWTGRFLDTEKSVIDGQKAALAIINYRISGQVEGDYILSWNPRRVAIDQTFLTRMGITPGEVTPGEESSSITLHLGAVNTPQQYVIPFYRTYAQRDLPNESWDTIAGEQPYITFAKVPQSGGESTR